MRILFLLFLILIGRTAFCDSAQQEKLTKYLSALVSMETETANTRENANALRWVEQQLSHLGLHFKRRAYNGHCSLIATTKETMEPDIFLVAHIDVVPAPKELFNPRIDGQKMYGRGVYDMKMAIACYMLLLEELQDYLPQLNIGLMLTSDEETGGMNGVKRLLEAGYASRIALLPDGGFNWNFEEEAKGVLHLEIAASGKSAHSSRPDLGENAIEILMSALEEIGHYFEQQKERHGAYHPTVNIGVIQGGKSVNQVPERAAAKIDIRYPSAISKEELYADLAQLAHKDPRLSFKRIAEGAAHHVDVRQSPFIRFQEIAKKLYGIEIGKTRSYGASDARFFGERNIPVLVIAPKGGAIHSDGEWIDLEDLTRFYNVLKLWVLENCLDQEACSS